ncbi:MAG: hypothetical protein ACLP19_03295 [Xanthobacteraceae bacterium]
MSWCDRLASTPAVGFKLTSHFAPIDFLLEALAPIIDRQPEEHAKQITFEQSNTNFSAAFILNDGFRYAATEAQVAVTFNHRARFRPQSGGPPTMEMLSTPTPFTALLPIVSERLIEATLLLPKIAERKVFRVGIVSTTPIADEDLPPGIRRMIEYVGRPWKGKFDAYNISLLMRLAEGEEVTERCTHTIQRPEERDQLMTLQFDWQRTFKNGWTPNKSNLERLLAEAQRDALKYFEDIAEGNRFDEELLRETVGV